MVPMCTVFQQTFLVSQLTTFHNLMVLQSMMLSVRRCLGGLVEKLASESNPILRHRIFDHTIKEYVPSVNRLFPMETPRDIERFVIQEVGRQVSAFMRVNNGRVDGRGFLEPRRLSIEQGVVAIPHGSALVSLGASQCFARTTLDPTAFSNPVDEVATKLGRVGTNFFVDYKMPTYSARNAESLSPIREHLPAEGNMITNAILPSLHENAFRIPTRVHCEVSTHDGSSEAIATLAASIALVDAGVCDMKPVASLTAGLYPELDIWGEVKPVWDSPIVAVDVDAFEELAMPAMLRVATQGDLLTSVALRSSCGGLPLSTVEKTLSQVMAASKKLGQELETQLVYPSLPKENIPCIETVQVQARDARFIIGPNGSNIRAIEAKTGCRVTLDNDSMTVTIAAPNFAALRQYGLFVKTYAQARDTLLISSSLSAYFDPTGAGCFSYMRLVWPGQQLWLKKAYLDDHRLHSAQTTLIWMLCKAAVVLEVDHHNAMECPIST
eukprot:m.96726 g.96726  ORF g.96726 m.96726 type:complete len:496 (+) comp14805_c0_seq4:67-1554(+)